MSLSKTVTNLSANINSTYGSDQPLKHFSNTTSTTNSHSIPDDLIDLHNYIKSCASVLRSYYNDALFIHGKEPKSAVSIAYIGNSEPFIQARILNPNSVIELIQKLEIRGPLFWENDYVEIKSLFKVGQMEFANTKYVVCIVPVILGINFEHKDYSMYFKGCDFIFVPIHANSVGSQIGHEGFTKYFTKVSNLTGKEVVSGDVVNFLLTCAKLHNCSISDVSIHLTHDYLSGLCGISKFSTNDTGQYNKIEMQNTKVNIVYYEINQINTIDGLSRLNKFQHPNPFYTYD